MRHRRGVKQTHLCDDVIVIPSGAANHKHSFTGFGTKLLGNRFADTDGRKGDIPLRVGGMNAHPFIVADICKVF